MSHSQPLPLPAEFCWGYATAAYQIEGAVDADNRGASIWDTFSHLSPTRTKGANGDIACDHYNRYHADIDLIKSYGAKHYRFSLSWSRMIPLGGRNDPISEAGVGFYNNLIDDLLEKGIEPWITLYHWDLPQALEDRYGGWLNQAEVEKDFVRYASLCFERFGNRVKRWITFNEPYIVAVFGYCTGIMAPGRSSTNSASNGIGDSTTEPWIVGKSLIMSHALVMEAYRQKFAKEQAGQVTIVLNGHYYEPWDAESPQDVEAAQRRMEFYIGWFADPIFLGRDYPASMRSQLGSRLPAFTEAELRLLRENKPKWYGMNHYTAKYARAEPNPPASTDYTGNVSKHITNKAGLEIGPQSGVSWLQVCPEQFRKILNWVWNRYGCKIIVTENGCPCPGEHEMDVAASIQDDFRVRYFAWSLMDNFEWQNGYDIRFGVTHVNYETLERTPKKSSAYLRSTFDKRLAKSMT
ncbi:family 1 glycoside hydrolase [Halenospora varia]|nr:family 1 glycoside hydrolase [Halenospora varia]